MTETPAEQEPAHAEGDSEQRKGAVVALRPGETSIMLRPGQAWWSERQLITLRNFYPANEAPSDADLMNFLHICLTTGLDPFRKEIYYIGREDRKAAGGRRFTAQTGIDGFRHIAERTGEYGGKLMTQWCGDDGEWRDVWLSPTPPAAARVAVSRKGYDHPFYGIAVYSEFVPMTAEWEGSGNNRRKKVVDGKPVMKPMGLWDKMPSHMLAKCAEAQAIRSAFPRQLAALYVEEEMHQADARSAGEAERAGQRSALADRPWANRSGVVLEPPTEVIAGEVLLPPREAMLEELANQARIMDRSLGGWTTRWVAARKKNVEDAEDRELWDLVTSRRDMVAEKAAEQGVEPFLAVAVAPAPADAPEAGSDPQEPAATPQDEASETERDNEAFEAARRGEPEPEPDPAPPAESPGEVLRRARKPRVIEGQPVADVGQPESASELHHFEPGDDEPQFCGFMGCQMAEGDPVHRRADATGQEPLL